jgi:archaemetzincin
MRIVSLVAVGELDRRELEQLAEGLAPRLRAACSIEAEALDSSFAFNPLRGQHNSTEILKRLRQGLRPETWRVLGVTGQDLFIPILTFVFGEAQFGPGPAAAAVASFHRLRQEFYGLPPDPALLQDRLLKEALHELGHTLGLRHCTDYRCVMSSSHAVENIDLKLAEFCPDCAAALEKHP